MGDIRECISESGRGTMLTVHVHPGSKTTGIAGYDMWREALVLKLKADARKGEANAALVSYFFKLFDTKVEIAKGERSRDKTLYINLGPDQVLEILRGEM